MKRLLLLVALIAATVTAQAAFVTNAPVTLIQPNGDTLHLFATGDEFYHRLHDADNYTVVRNSAGWYVYATKLTLGDNEWRLVPTSLTVGQSSPAAAGLTPGLAESPATVSTLRKRFDIPEQYRLPGRDAKGNRIGTKSGAKSTGTLNNIVIFIRLADDSAITTPYSAIDSMFNDTAASAISMRNFFRRASYRQLEIPTHFFPTPAGNTIVSYQDIYPRSYFQPYDSVSNTNGYQENERAGREFSLLERAVNYVNQYYPVPSNLNLDYDNDGLIDNICFVIAGTYTGWSDLLWPHKWSLYDRYVGINGKRVYTFNLQLEGSGSHYFSTSTFCHEMFHTLGAPDLYRYNNYTDVSGAGRWDLMCSNTQPPQYMSMYMKMRYGRWLDSVPEITEAGTYSLHSVGDSLCHNQVYRIQAGNPNQWYYLEYRDNSELFETGLPGSGLIVWRTDSRFNGNANFDRENYFDEVYVFRPGGDEDTVNGNPYQANFGIHAGRPSFDQNSDPFPWLTGNEPDTTIQLSNITVQGDSLTFTYTPHRPAAYQCADDNSCEITVTMYDQYGDTWNGAYLHFQTLNGDPIATMALGDCKYSETRTVAVCNEPVQVLFNGGSYPSECNFIIRRGDGTQWQYSSTNNILANPCGTPLQQYTVTVQSNYPEETYTDGGGTYTEGTDIRIDATASDDAHLNFMGWYAGPWSGQSSPNSSTNPHYHFTVTQDTVFTAIFSRQTFTVSAVSEDESRGTVTGSGTYAWGDTATLTALPNAGWVFDHWTVGGRSRNENPISFKVMGNSSYVAYFIPNVGIESPDGELAVAVDGHTVTIYGAAGEKLELFDITGRLIATAQSTEQTRFEVLHAGVYLIRTKSGKTQKVVVL